MTKLKVLLVASLFAGTAFGARWRGGETGSWQDAGNWDSADYPGGGQIWFTSFTSAHVTTDLDLGIPSAYSYLFHNNPDFELDLRGHALYASSLALGAGNDGSHLNAIPKARFYDGAIAKTDSAGAYAQMQVQIPAHTYDALDHGEYTFDTITFPSVNFVRNENAQGTLVRFTNCIVNITKAPAVLTKVIDQVVFEDSIVSNYLFESKHTTWPETGYLVTFDRSTFDGSGTGDRFFYDCARIHDSTLNINSAHYFSTAMADIRRSTIALKAANAGIALGTHGGGTVNIVDSNLTVHNGQFAFKIFGDTGLGAEIADKTVNLVNSTLTAEFDGTVTDQYWGGWVGYQGGTPDGCTLRMENSKIIIDAVNEIQARFTICGMTNFTWKIVGGGSVVRRVHTGEFAYDSTASRCQINNISGDSWLEFEVPKKGMDKPGLELDFPKSFGWAKGCMRLKVSAQKWVDHTGGEVCLLKSNGQFLWSQVADLMTNAVLPTPHREGDEVRLELRNNDLELWLVAPEVHEGLVILLK